jgi:hypothetical protein
VTVEPSERRDGDKESYIWRKIRFEGVENGLVFEGRVFDRRLDPSGAEKQLGEKSPQWTGSVKAEINHELTVEKRVSGWERAAPKSGPYLSMSIQDDQRPAT